MASDGKEERRRKIMQRGSDRMALITGQIKSLSASPSATTSNSSNHARNDESSLSIIGFQHAEIHATTESIRAPALEIQTSIRNQPKFFTSRRINSCIIASQRTRAICSLIIASLVLISCIDYPLRNIKVSSESSVIASRPLYVVLLTDATIVLAPLLFHDNGSGDADKEGTVAKDDGDNWVEAVKLLERGLAVYQAIRGIFIDCSVYLVVLVCGLSLLQF